jgi:hypothetical protein
MTTKTTIPWAMLKDTPAPSKGLIPGVGLRFVHHPNNGMTVERIFVDVGTHNGVPAMMRILRDRSLKSGWTRPDLVLRKQDDFTL